MHFANPYLSRSTTWVVGLLAAALVILCIV